MYMTDSYASVLRPTSSDKRLSKITYSSESTQSCWYAIG